MSGTDRESAATTSHGPPARGTLAEPGSLRRVAPALALFFLAPLCGEYLIGNVSVESLLVGLLILAPMYGGGAVVIREVARRAGRGWPTILLLGMAYGLLEAGLIDQSMFNPSPVFLESEEIADYWAESRGATFVPAFGISVQQTLDFVLGHAVTSIAVPILLVETFVPTRRTTPWLGKAGLAVAAVLYLLGSWVIYGDQTERFHASAAQALGAAAVAVALIAVAFAVGRRPRPRTAGRVPGPWAVGAVAFAVVVADWFVAEIPNWLGVALQVLLAAAMATLVVRWSRRAAWGATHRLALAGVVLLTNAASGFVLTDLYGRAGLVNLMGNVGFTLAVIALLVVAGRVARRTADVG